MNLKIANRKLLMGCLLSILFSLHTISSTSFAQVVDDDLTVSVVSSLTPSDLSEISLTANILAPWNFARLKTKVDGMSLKNIELVIGRESLVLNVPFTILNKLTYPQLETFRLYHQAVKSDSGWLLELHFSYGEAIVNGRCTASNATAYNKAIIYFNLFSNEMEMERLDDCDEPIS